VVVEEHDLSPEHLRHHASNAGIRPGCNLNAETDRRLARCTVKAFDLVLSLPRGGREVGQLMPDGGDGKRRNQDCLVLQQRLEGCLVREERVLDARHAGSCGSAYGFAVLGMAQDPPV
jgi:hypothetical protein